MTATMRALAASLAVVALASGVPAAPAVADVVVFGAASLKEALDEQSKRFEAASGNKVVVSYGASNTLARQIEGGAPADLFIAADLEWMDYAERRSLLRAGTRVNLLSNALVLIAPAASKSTLRIAPNFALADALGQGKLAMANPDSVPAGKYGKSALQAMGVWADIEHKVARAENVRAALALVSRGEAPFGIVYATDAWADTGVRIVDGFPPSSHPPIVYPAAIVASSKSPQATALLDYLKSPSSRAVWEKYGFRISQDP